MAGQEPVGSIDWTSGSGSGDAEGTDFIRCVDGREPHIHEFWTFGEDGVTHEVHMKAQVDVGSVFVRESATNYLTESWCRVPMFGRNSMNGCVQWLGIPNFLRTNGTAWNDNPLAPHPSWGDEVSITNLNWGS